MNARAQLIGGIAPAVVAGAAAIVLAGRVEYAIVGIVLQGAAVLAVAVMAWRTAALVTLPPVALVGEGATTEHAAAADRRRPGIDRMSGLCAPWYFRLRVEEEVARCERYGGALTVVRITGGTAKLNAARRVRGGGAPGRRHDGRSAAGAACVVYG
jgi:hypothetical protein